MIEYICAKTSLDKNQYYDRLRISSINGLDVFLMSIDFQDKASQNSLRNLEKLTRDRGWSFNIELPIYLSEDTPFSFLMSEKSFLEYFEKCYQLISKVNADYINLHLINPNYSLQVLTNAEEALILERVKYFQLFCHQVNSIAVLENVPPILRMGKNIIMYTNIGLSIDDFDKFHITKDSGISICLDVSHAGLSYNLLNSRFEEDPLYDEALICKNFFSKSKLIHPSDWIGNYCNRIDMIHLSGFSGVSGEGLNTSFLDELLIKKLKKIKQSFTVVLEPIEKNFNNAEETRKMSEFIKNIPYE